MRMNTSYRENRRTLASGSLLFDIEEHSMDRRTLLSDDGGASVAGTVGGDRTSATRVRVPTPTLGGEFKRRRNSYDNNDAAWIVANAHQKEQIKSKAS
jgi:hypothetical protein